MESTLGGVVLQHLRAQQATMTSLLMELARLESPTDTPPAVAQVLDRLSEEFRGSGMQVRRLRGQQTAGMLIARPDRRRRALPFQLLVGHGDTVWPVGTRANMPVELVNHQVRGPGVFDMKAGLVQMVFALRALAAVDCALPATPVVVVTSDEETGSPESRRSMVRLARRAVRAFVLEPAFGPTGQLKTARKAVGEFEIIIRGRAAHAGLAPASGASAILELSHQIQHLFAMNDPEHGVSVNVGTLNGGVRPNVIAAEVRAQIDVRVPTRDALDRLDAAMRALSAVNPDVSIEVRGGFHAPPLERTPRHRPLWQQAQVLGRQLGLTLEEAAVGGASDGNTISQYTATLDGLGAVGDGAHARHEFVDARSLPERAALLALLLAAPLSPAAGDMPLRTVDAGLASP